MQIAICDDIQKELETIRTALDTCAEAHPELHFDIDECVAAIDILNAVEKGKTYDIALLDICLPDGLGRDVAEEMLAKSPDMSIVFLSASAEYAVTAFSLNVIHYLLKAFSQEQFNEALDRAVKKTEDQEFLSLACVDGMYQVCVTEIVSIESQNHYLLLYLSSGELLKLRMKLSQIFERLQEYLGFIFFGFIMAFIKNLTTHFKSDSVLSYQIYSYSFITCASRTIGGFCRRFQLFAWRKILPKRRYVYGNKIKRIFPDDQGAGGGAGGDRKEWHASDNI